MQVEVEELNPQKKKLHITIPEEVVSQKVNDAYKILNRQISMPGFRPGKIPQHILEQQVPIQSFSNLFQDLMQDYYEQALRETGLEPVSQPEIDHSQLTDVRKNAPFKFSVVLDVRKRIELKNYKGLKFKKKEIVITDEQLERALERFTMMHGHTEPWEDDHPAEMGDIAVLDFDGFQGDEPLENGSSRDYEVRLGENKMIPGFEEQLVGHKVGEEFEARVVLPQQWNQKLRRVSMPVPGKEGEAPDDLATFKVRLKDLQKRVPVPLDDYLAKKEGCGSVDDLRRKLKADMQNFALQQEELRIKEEIFNQLVKEHDLEPPESLVDRELKFMIEGMKFQIEESGMKVEDSGFDEERAREEWKNRAIFNTRGYSILEAIAQKEGIHVTQQDMEEEYRRLAEQTGQKIEVVRNRMLAYPETMQQTTGKILGQKAMNYIYSNCEFEYVQNLPEKEEESGEGNKRSA
ncbi:MAG: trigger factor [Nitrospinae bacterium CG11_big_fil_rev_8_21_14_0_20_56_8]|nr:MAG: trigger factor [Nitrospinae bacterium CG11_big_fil_rev_8_21_14_0_20_56_8]